jgi:hypothetical protein
MTAVQQMAVVARTIVVKITQDGSARAPLMAGSTSSRAVKVGLLIIRIGWAMVGLLAARLSSHSVFPKLCKRHLQYVRENLRTLDYRLTRISAITRRRRRRWTDTRREANFLLIAMREV